LVNKNDSSVINLSVVPQDESAGGVVVESTEPLEGGRSVRLRKDQKDEKKLYLEVWSKESGFTSSLKVDAKVKQIYNDTVFGGVSWSRDGKKIVFIGEVPPVEKYNAYFKDPEEPKKSTEKTEGEENKEEEKKDEHWQEEKFLYKEDFGETLAAKSQPDIFVFDLDENKLE
jgi:hypothetical protein